MRVFIYLLLSIIVLYGCGSSPEKKIANLESTKDKILDLNNESLPRARASIFNIENQENDTYDVIRARKEFFIDLMEAFLDDATNEEVKHRIIKFFKRIDNTHGYKSRILNIPHSSATKTINGKEFLDVYSIEDGSTYNMRTKFIFYQEYAKLLGVSFNIKDRDFLAHELCEAVERNRLQYASALIDISVNILDPGKIRCIDSKDKNGFNAIEEFTGSTLGMRDDNHVKSSLGVCPMSLRRLSGRNYGRAVQSRISNWRSGIDFDRDSIKSVDDAKNKIKNTFRNVPSLNPVPGSMNSLLDRYDKTWARGGDCSLESNGYKLR